MSKNENVKFIIDENVRQCLANFNALKSVRDDLIYFYVDNGYLRGYATDLNNFLDVKLLPFEEDLSIFGVNIHKLLNILKSKKGDIEVIIKETELLFKQNKSKIKLSIVGGDSVPFVNNIFKPLDIKLDISLLNQVSYASSNDSIRPMLQSVYVEITNKDNYHIVSTNAHRLSYVFSDYDDTDIKLSLPIHKNSLPLLNLIKNQPEILISEDERKLKFIDGDIEIITLLLHGEYPNYKSVIPDYEKNVLLVDYKQFNDIINSFLLLSDKDAKIIFQLDNDVLKLWTRDELDEVYDEIPILENHNFKVEKFAVSLKYLKDTLNHYKGNELVFSMKTPESACVFIQEKQIDLIMPISVE